MIYAEHMKIFGNNTLLIRFIENVSSFFSHCGFSSADLTKKIFCYVKLSFDRKIKEHLECEISEKYDLQVLRFFMLSAHYRSPLNFSAELMESASNALERIVNAADNLRYLRENAEDRELTDAETELLEQAKAFAVQFDAAMDDDLNTADALAAVFELVRFANTNITASNAGKLIDFVENELSDLCGILGIFTQRKEVSLEEEVERLIQERQDARKAKDFARADAIRAELLEKGIQLLDTREGVKWKKI